MENQDQKEIRFLLKLEKSSPMVMDKGTAHEAIEWRTPNGDLHREYGPAVIWPNGEKEWWRDGMLHRDDGPAVEMTGGESGWYKLGKIHREDGPATIGVDGSTNYFLFGILYYNEEEWTKALTKLKK